MTLTIQDLGALGELLGSVAVLATLVYLALQTRQNTMAIAAQLDAARLSSTQLGLLTPVTSNELGEALREDSADDRSINQMRLGNYWLSTLLSLQWQLYQSRRGLLPTFNAAGVAVFLHGLFTGFRSFEGWWEGARRGLFLPEFVEWVEEQRSKAA